MGGFEPPALYVGAWLISFLATYILTPAAARLARAIDLLDYPSAKKIHPAPTPYLGGAAVAAGFLAVGVLAAIDSPELRAILLGGIALLVVGLADDWRTFRPSVKLAFQVVAGTGLWFAHVRASLFGVNALDLGLTVLWVVAVTNAVNIHDNMDGLSVGASVVGGLAFFVIAGSRHDLPSAVFALAVAGSALGFLPRNFPPAQVFLGDAGTLFLGFLLAGMALNLDLWAEGRVLRAALPVLVLGVPLLDTLHVMVARLIGGRPIHVGGLDHYSHRLIARGLSVRAVALLTYAVQVGLAAMALWLLDASTTSSLVALSAVTIASLTVTVLFLRSAPHRGEG